MTGFFSYLFFTIGFLGTIFGIAAAIIWAIEKSCEAKRVRDERHRELVRKLGDIEFQLKLKKDGL
jgi:hypothetical protein